MGDRPENQHADTIPASGPPDDAPSALRPLRAGERYRLGAELGRGGMGRVVEAFDIQLGRTVALKEVLPTITGTPRRFAREVQITARLEHPAIVPLYDAGFSDEGRPFYVMRRVSGRPLDELLAKATNLDERLVLLPAVLAAIDAIAHAHSRGVIHRDLKPGNILVGDLGETVVIDWGLAKVIGEADDIDGTAALAAGDSLQTQFGQVFGTPGFMSPEQARGEELDSRGDVYALGATLYQLLAGKPPHAGKTATELLDSTHRHQVIPLGEVSPNAPADLVAIVDKALAFELERRYPNAATLGEDVRRFLGGQLVAAHRYTRRQRVARFARKNRAPLVVAALAMVAVAVLAWIGVHRIVTERDGATRARAEALVNLRLAEEARDRSTERAEALVAARARSMLETNPTQAIAVLKPIARSKKLAPEVRAIAGAAMMRGVAWALDAPDTPTQSLEISADGGHVLHTTRTGTLSVWDLESRTLQLAKQLDADSLAMWVANGLVVVYGKTVQPVLLDPRTGTVVPLAVRPFMTAVKTAKGDRVLVIDDSGHAIVIDIATRTAEPLQPERTVTDVAIAPDGAWYVLADKARTWIVDRAGVELTSHDAPGSLIAVTGDRVAIAQVGGREVFEARAVKGAPWTQVGPIKASVFRLIYRGTELVIAQMGIDLDAWNGTRLTRLAHVDDLNLRGFDAAGDLILMPGLAGTLRFFVGERLVEVHLPGQLSHARFAAAPSSNRLLAIGDGLLVVYDLAALLPHPLVATPQTQALFVDDDTLLIHGPMYAWAWYDLRDDRMIPFDVFLQGLPGAPTLDVATGRVAFVENGPGGRVFVVRKNATKIQILNAEGKSPIAQFIPGGPLMFGLSDGRVMLAPDGEPVREVVKLDGPVIGLSTTTHDRFAAISVRGEVVRGDLATGKIERMRVPVHKNLFVATMPDQILIVEDHKLFTWKGGDLAEITRFENLIDGISVAAGGVTVWLRDRGMFFSDLSTAPPVRLMPPLESFAALSADGRTLAAIGDTRDVMVIDLPSRVRWTFPISVSLPSLQGLSPSKRRFAVSSFNRISIWDAPALGDDLAAALEQVTNAHEDEGVLVWPWQRASGDP